MKLQKTAAAILIRETRTLHQTGVPEKTAPTPCALADKIEELLLKVGYTNAQAMGVTIQLLTSGKVRVDFRDYTQRLELASPSDIMTRTEAVDVFDSHLKFLKADNHSADGFTQKIVFGQ
ncbi:MAG: hypothetical protein ACO3GO_02865 [Terrimicrobiaceae bacterium]